MPPDKLPLARICLEDPQVFEDFFNVHYRPLVLYSHSLLNDLEISREIVQSLFTRFWEQRLTLHIRPATASPFLYQCIKNSCLNYLNASKRMVALDDILHEIPDEDLLDKMIAHETEERIFKAVESLPEKCQQIFRLSRIDGLKHAEIASRLGLSEKTVENQIGIAIKKLSRLRKFLS